MFVQLVLRVLTNRTTFSPVIMIMPIVLRICLNWVFIEALDRLQSALDIDKQA